MKTTKIIIIATIATIIIIALCGIATASAESYTLTAVVTEWEQIGDTDLYNITVIDENGDEWGFMGEKEDARVGNLYKMTMMDHSAENEEEDEIIDCEYVTTLDIPATANWIK